MGSQVCTSPRGHFIGATILVLEPVEGLRFVDTLVLDVGDAVAVVVRVGTTVLVLEPVGVLGLVGALIGLVGDAVTVAVARGAAAAIHAGGAPGSGSVGARVQSVRAAEAGVVRVGGTV